MQMANGWMHAADDFRKDRGLPFWKAQGSTGDTDYRPKVLVVDDQRLIADTVREILDGAGYETAVAYNGPMALEMAARFRPDYLLSDVLMPKMSGVELAIEVRKKFPNAKVLLFSGQATITELIKEAEEQGYAFDLIPKPIHPTILLERLNNLK
jgi:CheY-like chemotaxis protein